MVDRTKYIIRIKVFEDQLENVRDVYMYAGIEHASGFPVLFYSESMAKVFYEVEDAKSWFAENKEWLFGKLNAVSNSFKEFDSTLEIIKITYEKVATIEA